MKYVTSEAVDIHRLTLLLRFYAIDLTIAQLFT